MRDGYLKSVNHTRHHSGLGRLSNVLHFRPHQTSVLADDEHLFFDFGTLLLQLCSGSCLSLFQLTLLVNLILLPNFDQGTFHNSLLQFLFRNESTLQNLGQLDKVALRSCHCVVTLNVPVEETTQRRKGGIVRQEFGSTKQVRELRTPKSQTSIFFQRKFRLQQRIERTQNLVPRFIAGQ